MHKSINIITNYQNIYNTFNNEPNTELNINTKIFNYETNELWNNQILPKIKLNKEIYNNRIYPLKKNITFKDLLIIQKLKIKGKYKNSPLKLKYYYKKLETNHSLFFNKIINIIKDTKLWRPPNWIFNGDKFEALNYDHNVFNKIPIYCFIICYYFTLIYGPANKIDIEKLDPSKFTIPTLIYSYEENPDEDHHVSIYLDIDYNNFPYYDIRTMGHNITPKFLEALRSKIQSIIEIIKQKYTITVTSIENIAKINDADDTSVRIYYVSKLYNIIVNESLKKKIKYEDIQAIKASKTVLNDQKIENIRRQILENFNPLTDTCEIQTTLGYISSKYTIQQPANIIIEETPDNRGPISQVLLNIDYNQFIKTFMQRSYSGIGLAHLFKNVDNQLIDKNVLKNIECLLSKLTKPNIKINIADFKRVNDELYLYDCFPQGITTEILENKKYKLFRSLCSLPSYITLIDYFFHTNPDLYTQTSIIIRNWIYWINNQTNNYKENNLVFTLGGKSGKGKTKTIEALIDIFTKYSGVPKVKTTSIDRGFCEIPKSEQHKKIVMMDENQDSTILNKHFNIFENEATKKRGEQIDNLPHYTLSLIDSTWEKIYDPQFKGKYKQLTRRLIPAYIHTNIVDKFYEQFNFLYEDPSYKNSDQSLILYTLLLYTYLKEITCNTINNIHQNQNITQSPEIIKYYITFKTLHLQHIYEITNNITNKTFDTINTELIKKILKNIQNNQNSNNIQHLFLEVLEHNSELSRYHDLPKKTINNIKIAFHQSLNPIIVQEINLTTNKQDITIQQKNDLFTYLKNQINIFNKLIYKLDDIIANQTITLNPNISEYYIMYEIYIQFIIISTIIFQTITEEEKLLFKSNILFCLLWKLNIYQVQYNHLFLRFHETIFKDLISDNINMYEQKFIIQESLQPLFYKCIGKNYANNIKYNINPYITYNKNQGIYRNIIDLSIYDIDYIQNIKNIVFKNIVKQLMDLTFISNNKPHLNLSKNFELQTELILTIIENNPSLFNELNIPIEINPLVKLDNIDIIIKWIMKLEHGSYKEYITNYEENLLRSYLDRIEDTEPEYMSDVDNSFEY